MYLNDLLKKKETKTFEQFVDKYSFHVTSDVLKDMNLYLDEYAAVDKDAILQFIYDRYLSIKYNMHSGYHYNVNIGNFNVGDNYLWAVYKHGTSELIERCVDKYIINETNQINDFTNHFKECYRDALRFCNGYATKLLISKTLDRLKEAEIGTVSFTGPYSDQPYLPMGEIYRTIRNSDHENFGWPPDEEKKKLRHQIVQNDMVFYLNNINIGILFKKGALYDWAKEPSSVLRDLEYLGVTDSDVIKKIKTEGSAIE